MVDHCGPQGDSLPEKLISRLIPDVVFGVDLSECCKAHDISWTEEANKSGDVAFREDIIDRFYLAGKSRYLALAVAWWYYIGVRLGGIFYKIGLKK